MLERHLFPLFFAILAFGGGAAEWGLVCWALRPSLPLAAHAAAVLLLGAVTWIPARRMERAPAPGPLLATAGHLLLPPAFAALAAVAALGAAATAAVVVQALGALRVEAGMAVAGVADPLLGGDFRLLGSAAITTALVTIAYGYVAGHRRLVVTRLAVPVAHLSPALAGLRVVHVSDLHLGPLADRVALRAALDRVVALDPDLVCVTGDVVDSPATDLDAWLPELARLRARHGVFAILGNHDRRTGADRVAAGLRRWTSWHVLRDEVATVEVAGASLHVVGLEDRPREEAAPAIVALLARVPAGEAAILLVHHPEVFPDAAAAGAGVVLAGHTHGGQIAVPGLPRINLARLAMRFDAGRFVAGGALLHVSRGLGTSGQRVRVGVPREIAVLELRAA
jgi:hypothetical protein